MTFAVELADLSIRRSGRPIVHGLSARITQTGWFGVIGANGSGKTTLLRAVAGRLPIAGGRCTIFGQEVAQDRDARATAIGLAPPIERLPASLTIRELLALAGDDPSEQAARNAALWQALGIDALLDMQVGQCSSGMRQRAALALAFARPTHIVILDEPFNWLDPVAAFDTRAALAGMVADGLTLITALHDLTTLCGFCDAGLVMAKGEVSLYLDKPMLRAGREDAARFESELVAALR
ncbi:MAG: ATP-binding cassette domain-containing protein [Erythrobacter sp.]|nr:ATP-binding cassette domain-containing protein [Erythrobacter sp.]NCQ62567.1 ATP-binding cassette domain-containing protein [Alphaproteobacteria bacterium]